MSKVYFTSDLHLGHYNIIKYSRPQYTSIDEMHLDIIAKWNSLVKKRDSVWILGDVAYGKKGAQYLSLLNELNGTKKLVLGNHDIFGIEAYLPYFKDICGCATYKGTILTHIPVHSDQLEYRFKYNIHGHLHNGHSVPDDRYINVNMDSCNMTPMSWEEVKNEVVIK